jgi:hypothetical protein
MSGVEFEIDLEPFYKTLDATLERIQQFPGTDMPEELTVWQVEDMRRTYPNTVIEQNSCYTEIWPRSRVRKAYVPTGHPRGRPVKALARPPKTGGVRQVMARRPVLRAQLEKQLYDRMGKTLFEKVKWMVGGHGA